MNWYRRTEPFDANGSRTPGGWGSNVSSLAQNKDVANKEMRTDVYTWVVKGVDGAANTRSDKPPSVGNFEAYKGAAPVPEFAHPSWKDPDTAQPEEDAELQTEFLGNPERVNVLDPIAYQTRANRNTLDGGI